jgi:hypothetical protein
MRQPVAIANVAPPESSSSTQNDWRPEFALANTSGASMLQADVDCYASLVQPNLCRMAM